MKKVFSLLISIALICSMFYTMAVFAADKPLYDPTFDNNQGAFFANGTDITISRNTAGNTIITWDGGSQIVPNTVSVFGGGNAGTTYESSNITMNDGTVQTVYGGGFSTDPNKLATVGTSNIEINGGNIEASLIGGGLLYTSVGESNVNVNGGTITAVCGGGLASAVINGVPYDAGSEDKPLESKCRIENANVTINGGTIDTIPSSSGLVYGGGQGYSYTGDANLIINDGNLQNAYVTAGGSNGYTGDANVEINGGSIGVLQTVNRGIVDSADVKVTGGNIENAYIGGENAPDVTGTINNVEYDVIGGKIENLDSGLSGSQLLVVDQNNYKAVYVDGTVDNTDIGGRATKINYDFSVDDDVIYLYEGETRKIKPIITTTPPGYEGLFDTSFVELISRDPNVVEVIDNDEIEGISKGQTIVTAKFLDKIDTIDVTVNSGILDIVLIGLVILGILAVLFGLLLFA